MKRKSLASICQKARRETNMSVQPSGLRASCSIPTDDSSDVIKPMRSSFCRVLRDLNMPSLRILMRQSALGRPNSGVAEESSVFMCGDGGSFWKYQHSVAHNIMATCREGEAGVLKSLLEGTETEDMKRESPCNVGLVKRCVTVSFWVKGGGSSPLPM